jgi:undecaprenyl phosphate-alpha-L-ara4FN deformylase
MQPGKLNVHTVHAELEGGPHLDVLEALLSRVERMARVVRLCDEAAALDPGALPICGVREGRVPGRAMPVAVQGPSIAS